MSRTRHDAIRSVARLHRILEAAKLLNSTLDLAELTAIILRIARDEVGVDRGTVFVLERPKLQLRSLVAQDVGGREIVVPLGEGIAGAVAQNGKTIDVSDAYADTRFEPRFDTTLGYRTQDIYCLAIVNRVGDIVGVLELLNRTRPLTDEDEAFLAGVSVHVGLALENARMHLEIVEKRRMDHELVLAREIQQNFYPKIPASCAGVEISASVQMCRAVGGDYLGYFPLDEGRFLVAVGDVSGKGIGAALVMSSVHATCRALVPQVHAIEEIVNALNETFIETTGAATFVTMLLMLVDPVGERVHYVRAGHNPPFKISGTGSLLTLVDGGGPPIGLFPNVKYCREIRTLESGAVLVVYTDGVSEAENALGEDFGADRLIAVASAERAGSAAHIHASIRLALQQYIGDEPLHDDSTLIVLKRS